MLARGQLRLALGDAPLDLAAVLLRRASALRTCFHVLLAVGERLCAAVELHLLRGERLTGRGELELGFSARPSALVEVLLFRVEPFELRLQLFDPLQARSDRGLGFLQLELSCEEPRFALRELALARFDCVRALVQVRLAAREQLLCGRGGLVPGGPLRTAGPQ